ncbi:hypothetical protein HY605_00180 [Candidatus Peregrinibacteria bacterium]|nr:hypothetical protein [Candidatus Peregrinibacteria bacterium]
MRNWFLFIGITLLLSGCLNTHDVESPSKSFQILEDGNVYLEGRWKQIGSTSSHRIIPKHNSVVILCDKKSGLCTENQALLVTKKDNPVTPSILLYPEQNSYIISEWSNTVIKAERKPRAADVEIRISLVDKSVEKSFRETQARGSDTANPNIVGNWILE